MTSGESKDRFDPLKPVSEQDKQKANVLLNTVHNHFIAYVKASRKHLKTPTQAGIKPSADNVFTGDFWVGSNAIKLGLADKTGDLYTAAQENFGTDVFVDYTQHPSIIHSFMSSAVKDFSLTALSVPQSSILETSSMR